MSVLTHHTYRVRAIDLETEMRRAKKSKPCALDYIVLLSRRTTAQLRTETFHTWSHGTKMGFAICGYGMASGQHNCERTPPIFARKSVLPDIIEVFVGGRTRVRARTSMIR
jgi:hypothetical protein